MKLMMAAVAATFMSTGAQAGSFSESCGHLDNPTRFNPTELSAYQECWLDYHKPDEMAGTLGGIFYARAGDSIVSMPVSDLRSAGSAGAAKQKVVDAILLAMAEQRVEELEGMVADLEEAKAGLVDDLAAAVTAAEMDAATISGLRSNLAAVEATRDMLQGIIDGEPARIQAAIDAARQGIIDTARMGYVTEADRDAHGVARYNAGYTDGSDAISGDLLVTGVVVGRDGSVRVNTANGSFSFMRGAGYVTDSYNAGHADGIVAGRVGYVTESQRDTDVANAVAAVDTSHDVTVNGVVYTFTADGSVTVDITTDNMQAIADARMAVMFPTSVAVSATKNITIPAAVETGYNYDNSHTNTGIGNAVFWHHSGAPGSTVNGFNNSYWIGTTNALVEAIQETYDAGFNDGYDEGYADGYSDGFRDGVRAVQ